MSAAPEVAGFVGVVVAAAAYVPQITHLIGERCSAGVSRLAFAAWLTSSALMTAHALAIGAGVFIVLGVVQVSATALILVFAVRYEHSFCASTSGSRRWMRVRPWRPFAYGRRKP